MSSSIHVPNSWDVKKIPDVLFFQEGPGVRKWQFQESGVKLLNVGNINNGKIDLSSTKIFISEDEAFGKYAHFLVDPGDLLIACSGILLENFHNKISFVDDKNLPLCLNTSTMRFRSLDDDILNLKYFKYFLQTEYFNKQLRRLITGSAQLNFGPSHIKKIDIILPPLAEQKQIASILDAADSLRQKDQQLVEHYTVLSQSLFLEMFGDPVTNSKGFKIGTIRELVSSAKYGTSSKAQDNGSYPYLRMNNITYDGYMDFNSLKYINLDEKEKEKYIVKKGDVLFNRTNSKELVGKTGIFNEDTEMAIAGYLIRLRVNEYANPYFIWGYLNSRHGKLTLNHMCKNIVGMANINAQELQNIKILCPPVSLQNQFAERIAIIEQQKQQAQTNLQKSEALFNSLLQRAFTGELTADKAA